MTARRTALTAQQIIDYYSLRFQTVRRAIEFDFRDAKQFFGLSSFKNYKATQVTNAVNLAFTMTLISRILLEKYQVICQCPTMGIWDLKTLFRAVGRRCTEIRKIDRRATPFKMR